MTVNSRKSSETLSNTLKTEKTKPAKKIRLLIELYISEQNVLGSRYGILTYLLGFSDFQKNSSGELSVCRSETVKKWGRCQTLFLTLNAAYLFTE